MASISLINVQKKYTGGTDGLVDCSLEISDGEFFGLVGPSGCGKTTVLKLISGLEKLTTGELYFDGRLMNDIEPKHRDVAMVFENYSLDFKKSVYDNLAYGLKLRNVDNKEIATRVASSAELLDISHILKHKPKELSVAEIKRVELARAAVRRPNVFLMDEPLTGLTDRSRMEILLLIKRLWRELGITFVYSTRSFAEAKILCERTAILKNCILHQTDVPDRIYEKPSDMFVASYTGDLPINIFKTRLVKEGGLRRAAFGEHKINVDIECDDRELFVGIRPEDIALTGNENYGVNAVVDVVERLGNESLLYMSVDGKEDYTLVRTSEREFANGERVCMYFDPRKLHYFDVDTEIALRFD